MSVDPGWFSQLDMIRRDVVLDALRAASAQQWRERAEVFRAARPRPGDFLGASTVEERRDRWRRLTEAAKACEARAAVLENATPDAFPEIEDFDIGEAA